MVSSVCLHQVYNANNLWSIKIIHKILLPKQNWRKMNLPAKTLRELFKRLDYQFFIKLILPNYIGQSLGG